MASRSELPPDLTRARYLRLVTYRRDGTAVATPVWFAPEGDRLLVFTGARTGKARRIRANPAVSVAPCTARGRPTGPAVSATAVLLPDGDGPAVRRALARRYRLVWPLFRGYLRLAGRLRPRPPQPTAYLAITPSGRP